MKKIAVITKNTTFNKTYRGLDVHTKALVDLLSEEYRIDIFAPKRELKNTEVSEGNKQFYFIDVEYRTGIFSDLQSNKWNHGLYNFFKEKYEINKYDKLPNSELCLVIDNNGVCAIDEADRIALVSDMLPKCLENDQSFPGVPYLQANKDKVALYQKELNKYKNKLVGISWRSSLTTYSRVEHYLTIHEIEPIFQINNIQFVNFQYDECEEELKWVEERYPNKIINFAKIDQYNDFDSVAALMSCMDLIIAPATTVVELAGALGCNTWLLSNSSELYWRKINREKTDIWHKNVTHVEGEILGNKASLVKELVKKLEEYSLIEC